VLSHLSGHLILSSCLFREHKQRRPTRVFETSCQRLLLRPERQYFHPHRHALDRHPKTAQRKPDSRKAAKVGGLTRSLPVPPVATIKRMLRKTETLSFRLTPEEKEGLRVAASSVGMSISDYVVKCHEAVAKHMHR